MVSLYYALPKEKESDCQRFNLSVQLLPGNLVPSVSLLTLIYFVLTSASFSYEKRLIFIQIFVPPEKMAEDEKIYRLKITVL